MVLGAQFNSFVHPVLVLMALFGKLIEMAQAIVQVANINLETMPANASASSTLAVIEQQSKTFNALFKRFYRGLNGELRMLAALNKRYLDENEEFAIAEKRGRIEEREALRTGRGAPASAPAPAPAQVALSPPAAAP